MNQDSAAFAKGHKAVCLFVNDDGSAPVSGSFGTYKVSCIQDFSCWIGFVFSRRCQRATVLTAVLPAGIEGSSRPWCQVHCHEVQVPTSQLPLLAHHCLHITAVASPMTYKLWPAQQHSLIFRCAGFDKVDVEAAESLGISVARVPTYSPHSIAEHAVSLMMCLNR